MAGAAAIIESWPPEGHCGQPSRGRAGRLSVEGIGKTFGGLTALSDVTFTAEAGSITAVIGPNGAGKTTLFNIVSGFYRADRGTVSLDNNDISREPAHTRSGQGVIRTFQNLALYSGMTVMENIKLGAHPWIRTNIVQAGLFTPGTRRQERQLEAIVQDEIAPQLSLNPYLTTQVEELPYGTQKRVELARALIARPRVLLLDEPVAGMNEDESAETAHLISQLRERLDLTVLLIEHDMRLVMGISDVVVVLNFGQKIAEGQPESIKRNAAVIQAYLGFESPGEAGR